MVQDKISELFDLNGKVALLTGGGGVLTHEMAAALAACGAEIVAADISLEGAKRTVDRILAEGGRASALQADVLDADSLHHAGAELEERYGGVDILVNAAGGNRPGATASADLSFFDIAPEEIRKVIDLNLLGTILPTQVFGKTMLKRGEGVVINISSMNSFRPLTRIVGYSAGKAAVNNFTQWLAVYMAQNCSPRIRVNAIAPGFFETAQNKYLLRDESGELSARGKQIIAHTPMGRFGVPQDLIGTLIWLVSPGAQFVSGVVVPVDGGFSAFSGV